MRALERAHHPQQTLPREAMEHGDGGDEDGALGRLLELVAPQRAPKLVRADHKQTARLVRAQSGLAPGAVEGADGTGDVEDDVAKPEVDIVLALHACDVATDEAIARAVRWNAPLTLVSPCCHHDLQVRLRDAKIQPFPPLSRHGILRERLGDIITDAFRAHVLRLLGHRVSVAEWIGGGHTARNGA